MDYKQGLLYYGHVSIISLRNQRLPMCIQAVFWDNSWETYTENSFLTKSCENQCVLLDNLRLMWRGGGRGGGLDGIE